MNEFEKIRAYIDEEAMIKNAKKRLKEHPLHKYRGPYKRRIRQ